jgi:hypothetical protein
MRISGKHKRAAAVVESGGGGSEAPERRDQAGTGPVGTLA